jgi:hypothetical protein
VIRDKYEKSVERRAVAIQSASVPAQFYVFSTGDSLISRAEPNIVFVKVQDAATQSLGLLTKDPTSDSQLKLVLSLSLSVDALTAELASKKLAVSGEQLDGIFDDWDLRANEMPPGVLSIQVSSFGSRLDLYFTIEQEMASLFVWRLSSDNGLPIKFDWTAKADPDVHGTLTLPISLQRSEATTFAVSGNTVRNTGKRNLSIAYVKWGSSEFVPLQPELVVKPGEVTQIAAPVGHESRPLTVPPSTATSEWPDHADISSMFSVPAANEIVQEIAISDRLTGYNPTLNEQLRVLEVAIHYNVIDGSSRITKVDGGTIRLAPSGSQGDTAHLSFIKPTTGRVEVDVTGKAIYENSSIDLKERLFDTVTANITDEMLPQQN